jgi:hypothetical protein
MWFVGAKTTYHLEIQSNLKQSQFDPLCLCNFFAVFSGPKFLQELDSLPDVCAVPENMGISLLFP